MDPKPRTARFFICLQFLQIASGPPLLGVVPDIFAHSGRVHVGVTVLPVVCAATGDEMLQRETRVRFSTIHGASVGSAVRPRGRAIFGNFGARGVVGLGDTERHAAKATLFASSSELAGE